MIVGILLSKGKRACAGAVWNYFSLLDLFPVLTCPEAEALGRCKDCTWACHCHPIIFPFDGVQHGRWIGGTALCTLDFRAKYMPKLKLSDLP